MIRTSHRCVEFTTRRPKDAMATTPILFWFRQDLRLTDNRALAAACDTGQAVLPVYVLDDESPGAWRMGGASPVSYTHLTLPTKA